MKSKTKFFATIMAMCLVVTLGVIGILAVKTLNMSVGGNISFSADGLSLEVSAGTFKGEDGAEYSNITTQSGKMQGFKLTTDTKLESIQSLVDSWSGLDLHLGSQGDASLHFTIKNNMSTTLYVYIETTLGTNTNDNMNIIVTPQNPQIVAGETTAFTIKFDIIDTNINAGLSGFKVAIEFSKQSLIQTQYVIDETTGLPTNEVDYYFVEMGTYNDEPVRWRYVADSNGTRYDNTKPLTSLKGYYVLETIVLPPLEFLASDKYDDNARIAKHIAEGYTNINGADYGLSDVRAYLTNTGSGGFLETIGITGDNAIYQMITSRSLTELYQNIIYKSSTYSTIDSTDTKYSLSLTGDKDISNQSDKLWLLSHKEASTFFIDAADRKWGTGPDAWYWLRSPYLSYEDRVDVWGEGTVAFFKCNLSESLGVRPAFKI